MYQAESKVDGVKVFSQKEDKIAQALSCINKFFNGQSNEAKPLNSSGGAKPVLTGADVIDTIDIKDPQKRVVLQLLCFKPSGYALISALAGIPTLFILFKGQIRFRRYEPRPGELYL